MTAGEVQRALEEPQPLAYTTVVTVLSRLHAAGLLDRSGRAGLRLPLGGRSPRLAARRMHRVLDAEEDRDAVLARFVGGLSADDEEVRDVCWHRPDA